MARARREASAPTGFLYLKALDLVKISFRTDFHYLLLQAASRGAVVSGTALQGNGFDSRRCHLNFSLTQSFRTHYRPGVDSVSNRNEYSSVET